MLYARAYARRLNARNVRLAERARKIGIFGKIFEISPAERVTLYIEPRREQKIDAERGRFLRYGFADPVQQIGTPAVGEHGRGGKARCGNGARAVFHAHAVGPVRHSHARQIADTAGMPHPVAGQHIELVLERQALQDLIYVEIFRIHIYKYTIAE